MKFNAVGLEPDFVLMPSPLPYGDVILCPSFSPTYLFDN